MHLNLSNQMTMKQEHVMSPNMIKSMEILQLNSMGLLEKVDQELEDNPLLENENSEDEAQNDESFEAELDSDDSSNDENDEQELVVEDNDNNEDDFERLVEMASEWPEDNVMTAGAPSSNAVSDMRERQDD